MSKSLTTRIFLSWIGFIFAHLTGLKILYNNTSYVRDRIDFEKSIDFDRSQITELLEDYPFAHKGNDLFNDFEIRNSLVYVGNDKSILRKQMIKSKQIERKEKNITN